jgi:cell shape-determining protein MreC
MPSESSSAHVPIAILSLAVAIYFGTQLRANFKQAEIMRWQSSNLEKQSENLKQAKVQFEDTLEKSQPTITQAKQLQEQYVNLFTDLLELAKDDKDAKDVVDKFGIKKNEPPPKSEGAKEEKKEK